MSLPPALLAALEAHDCFSGVFDYDATAQMVIDPTQPPELAYVVHCCDCLLWHVGALRRDLPPGTDGYALARQASAHVAAARSYDAAIGGYHATPAGFWLSAVYLASIDAFLLDGHRSRSTAGDLALLVRSFQHGLWKPADAGMTDPARYTTQSLHVAMAGVTGPWNSVQDFLASPAVHAGPGARTRPVTLAAYQRATAAAPAPAAPIFTPAPPVAPVRAALREGETCPVCHREVRWRQLLTSSYLGCMC